MERRNNLYNKYKILRNNLIQKKRDSKIEYYKSYFAKNTSKIANIWKGIRSLIKIKLTSAKDILILDDNVYEVKSKAVTEQFDNLSTSRNCRENAFRIAKHIANANKDVIGDTCVKNDNRVATQDYQ